MLCHHTFSLLCPRSRKRTSPKNQQKQPMTPNKTKVPVEIMEKLTKLKLQKTLLKSLVRSIYILLHLPTKNKDKVFVPNKQTNPSNKFLPNNKTTQQNKKNINTTLPIDFTDIFSAMLFIVYIYIYLLHHQVQTPLQLESSRWKPSAPMHGGFR